MTLGRGCRGDLTKAIAGQEGARVVEWTPTRVKATLTQRGLAPLHRLGQHFLVDARMLRRIAEATGDPRRDCLEIGPGLGGLTEALCALGHRVVAVEVDRGFVAYLREGPLADRVTLIEGDALELDLETVLDPGGNVLCGNLPYYLTSPLLHRALALPFEAYVVMVQREVADRLCAPAGDPVRGTLSVLTEAVGKAVRLFDVPPSAFYPQPDVASAVIRIERSPGGLDGDAFRDLERMVGHVFRYRRKSLRQGLRQGFSWPADRALDVLEMAHADPAARPTDLRLETWLMLVECARQSGVWGDGG